MTKNLLFVFACFATIAAVPGCDTASDPESESFEFRSSQWTMLEQVAAVEAFANAEVQLVSSHAATFDCLEGMAVKSQYSMSYPVCTNPLPGYCTDVYEVIQECIDGEFQTTDETLIAHECGYSYSGATCGGEPTLPG